jgi:hypothetical protein
LERFICFFLSKRAAYFFVLSLPGIVVRVEKIYTLAPPPSALLARLSRLARSLAGELGPDRGGPGPLLDAPGDGGFAAGGRSLRSREGHALKVRGLGLVSAFFCSYIHQPFRVPACVGRRRGGADGYSAEAASRSNKGPANSKRMPSGPSTNMIVVLLPRA